MIKESILRINARILRVCSKINRNPEEISIVTVSKGRSPQEIREVILAGITDIGENRVQETLLKYQELSAISSPILELSVVKWHMVGHLQTNKVKEAVKIFDLIQSVDSLDLAAEIDKQAAKINKIQDILIEIKTSTEATKLGLKPDEAIEVIKEIVRLKNINIKGLMTIAPLVDNPEKARPYFRMLRELRDRLSQYSVLSTPYSVLSMGMSDDFEAAIEEGSNMVRLGRAIFEGWMKRKIGIIGFGNMGSAIGQRLKARYQICVFDEDRNKTQNLSDINVVDNVIALVNIAETVILAVKPQDFDSVLGQIKGYVQDKLIVSIAVGITTGYMEKILGKVKIIRAMPNIGVKIAEAQTCLCKGRNAEDQDLCFVRQLFDEVGKTWVIKEEMIDAATAISGSGPAYIYYDMEINKINPFNVSEKIKQGYIDRLKAAAEKVSFNSEIAMDLAVSTSGTSLHLARVMLPAELIKLITSKGGTTEAALQVLAKGGSWEEAALAAKKRAEELSKKE